MYQVDKYVSIIRSMPEPIYVPGDAFGVVSYVCRMLGKKCVSSEPEDIGIEARWLGLVDYKEGYKYERVLECKSVFLGNMVAYLSDLEYMQLSSHPYVVQWDEIPRTDKGTWYNLGDVRAWSTKPYYPIMQESKVIYERILVNLQQKYFIVPQDQLSQVMCKKLGIQTSIANDKEKLHVVSRTILGEPSYNMFTRSFSYDLTNARPGHTKDVGELIEWYPDVKYVLDGYYGPILMKKHDDNVLRKYEYNGEFFTSVLAHPGRKHYVQLGETKLRIVLAQYSDVTKEAVFVLASDYAYTKEKISNLV